MDELSAITPSKNQRSLMDRAGVIKSNPANSGDFELVHRANIALIRKVQPNRFAWLAPTITIVSSRIDSTSTPKSHKKNPSSCSSKHPIALYEGLPLALYSDSAWAYHENLMGTQPMLFVCGTLCPRCGMHPEFVSVNPYDVSSHEQGEDSCVVSAPLYGDIWKLVDAFTVQWHRPVIMKKRKRKNWIDSEDKKRG